MAKIRELRQGEMFTLHSIEEPRESQVWIRKEYDRSEKKYWCQRWSDISDGRYMSGNKEVFTDFYF